MIGGAGNRRMGVPEGSLPPARPTEFEITASRLAPYAQNVCGIGAVAKLFQLSPQAPARTLTQGRTSICVFVGLSFKRTGGSDQGSLGQISRWDNAIGAYSLT